MVNTFAHILVTLPCNYFMAVKNVISIELFIPCTIFTDILIACVRNQLLTIMNLVTYFRKKQDVTKLKIAHLLSLKYGTYSYESVPNNYFE